MDIGGQNSFLRYTRRGEFPNQTKGQTYWGTNQIKTEQGVSKHGVRVCRGEGRGGVENCQIRFAREWSKFFNHTDKNTKSPN